MHQHISADPTEAGTANGRNGVTSNDPWTQAVRAETAATIHHAREVQETVGGATRPEAAADALADLRAVMARNADVFDSSEVLAHTSRFANGRGAEQYSVACGVLMRAVLAVPPHVVLPPIIGSEVSLNLLLAHVGASSGGKGTADKTAAAAVRFSVAGRRMVQPEPMLPLGTGEGINRTYAFSKRDTTTGQFETKWLTDTALFGCRDIATLAALGTRQGATLIPELLKAFMGEELGFANADKERRVILPMHSYRLCLSAGVQPENGEVLLNPQAMRDGWPQRITWSPVRPGVVRARRLAGVEQVCEPITVVIPDFDRDPMNATLTLITDGDDFAAASAPPTFTYIGVPLAVHQTIIDVDAVKDPDPFGRTGDPLAGHRLLAQLKIAAALAVVHNRTDIADEDWQRAERFIEVSTKVADAVAVESNLAAERDAERRGHIDGHRLASSDTARNATKVRTVMERIERYLARQTGWTSSSTVRRSLSLKLREHFEEAVLALEAGDNPDGTGGVIEARASEHNGQRVVHYRLRASGQAQ